MKRWITITLCLLLLLVFGCSERVQNNPAPASEPGTASEAASEPESSTAVGELSFDTVTLDGDPIKAGMIREYDLVIVNCWAEWCGPCVGEMPELERLHQEYPNVLFLGVLSFTNNVEDAKTVIADTGVTYPVIEPAGSLVDLVNQFDAIPATMFFDKTGKQIAEPAIGSNSYEGWKAIIEDLLP